MNSPWFYLGAGMLISFTTRMLGKLVWFYFKPTLKRRRKGEGYGW